MIKQYRNHIRYDDQLGHADAYHAITLRTNETQGTRAARLTSCYLGRVFIRSLAVSAEQIEHLEPKSKAAFRKVHGDYFVAGYVIGAERAAHLTAVEQAKSFKEESSVTVSVKIIGKEFSDTTKNKFEEMSKHSEVRVMGFDTLNSRFSRLVNKDGIGAGKLHEEYWNYSKDALRIEKDIADRMQQMELKDKQSLSIDDCNRLYESGLVVQVVLLPYSVIEDLHALADP
jgi:hypothetical protein